MPQIFLSYRVSDEPYGAAMLDHMLSERFGSAAVFLASKSIPLGSLWERHMFEAVANSVAMLVIMGDRWLSAADKNGKRRLDDPTDFVRREILAGLELEKQVIPTRFGVARLEAADLPAELRPLADRQDIEVRFRSAGIDIERLAGKLRELIPALRDRPVPETETAAGKFAVNAREVGHVVQGDAVTITGDMHAGPRYYFHRSTDDGADTRE
ncbi:MAG TPA: TIR domain-containing protein [Actinophytocola sp.]|uniref:TIR domain-containing protein n=1 Tax=Actinophytocola sp. TaxID=1872138 RepID=UPI002DBC25B3|nr:TIR domain-containing protein [Actinophytocola sp.]HEU5470839.1 TIR domain-containing protein [Actinophytocola sp.]